MFHPLRPRDLRPLAYSLTLTSRSGDAPTIRAKLAAWLGVIARRARGVSILGALDRSPRGRWHVHALVLAPPRFDPARLTRWWCRVWPWKNASGAYERPSAHAQHVRALSVVDLANDIDRVLTHHLGRTRTVGGVRVPIAGLPALHERVAAYGALARVWERVCTLRRMPVACAWAGAHKRRLRSKKMSTLPSRPKQTWRFGESCAWCAKALTVGTRRDARYCGRCCGSAASRALRALEQRVGTASELARTKVIALEGDGWLRRDAIHAVYTALEAAKAKGACPASAKIRTPKCRCGHPLAPRCNALTCGRGACRSKAYRRRCREQRRRMRIAAFFSVLLRTRRWRPFSVDDARALGASMRVRARYVDALLRELVEEDGTAYVLHGHLDHYAFVPPRTRRLAA